MMFRLPTSMRVQTQSTNPKARRDTASGLLPVKPCLPSFQGPLKLRESLVSDMEPFQKAHEAAVAHPTQRFGAILSNTGKYLETMKRDVPTLSKSMKGSLKPRPTISTAPILHRKPMKSVANKRQRHRQKHTKTEHDLYLDYQEGVESARSQIFSDATENLNEAQAKMTKSVNVTMIRNLETVEAVSEQRKSILTPLTEEFIQTTFQKAGKRITETINIGEKMEDFRALVDKKEAELKIEWAEWDAIVKRLLELGVDVLGVEGARAVTGHTITDRKTKTYTKDMELWDAELEQQVKEIEEDIKVIKTDMLDKMTAAEKEIDARLKQEQASFFVKLFADE